MKTTLYKVLIALLLVPAISFASDGYKGKYTKQKKLKKEYTVSANDLLKIDNSYGNIDVTTWDQNRVVIEVMIETNGNNEEKVEERLREIDVRFNQSGNTVSAKTLFDKGNNSFWSSLFGGSSNVNMEINYRVKAPATNNVNLVNDYGSINLDRLEGNATISCDYGRILVGELLGEDNVLSFDYTRKSSIHYVKKAKISADYSEFTIEEAGTVNLSADYTDSYFQKVENLGFSCDYGSLKVDKLKNAKGSGDYLDVKLGMLYGTANIGMDYGSFSIDKIMASLKELNLNTDYTSIKIGYDREAPFSFEISTEYGGTNGLNNSGFTVNKKRQSTGDNYYQGYYRSGNSGGKVKIESSYGSVSFTD